MYLTYIKNKNNLSYRNVQTNIIDALFNDVVQENEIEITQNYYTTITTCVDFYEKQTKFETNATTLYNYIKNFLEENNVEDMYYEFKIPKKSGGLRTIDAPNELLKETQKEVSNFLERKFKMLCHNSAYAYIKHRSIVDAMIEHQKNKSRWYLKIDLKDFFGSCNKNFIVTQLSKLYPFANQLDNPNTLRLLNSIADVACLNDKLPQGTPLSPSLTNYLMVEFDYKITKKLNELSKENNELPKQRYVYTRYADDIIISAKEKFNYNLIVSEINNIFENTPLTINQNKTRFGSNAGRNWNLGVMLNKDNVITVGHKKKKYIKDKIYNWIKFKEDWDLEQCQWLQGNLAWLEHVEPEYFKGLMDYYKSKFNVDVWIDLLQQIKTL